VDHSLRDSFLRDLPVSTPTLMPLYNTGKMPSDAGINGNKALQCQEGHSTKLPSSVSEF